MTRKGTFRSETLKHLSRCEKLVVATFLAAVGLVCLLVGAAVAVVIAFVYGFLSRLADIQPLGEYWMLLSLLGFALTLVSILVWEKRADFTEKIAKSIVMKMRRKKSSNRDSGVAQ
jgi:hypothetical protein